MARAFTALCYFLTRSIQVYADPIHYIDSKPDIAKKIKMQPVL